MKRVMMAALALLAMVAAVPAMAQSGCGIGVGAGYVMGSVDLMGPIGMSSSGQKVDIQASCDMRLGGPIVVGAFASYGWMMGDIKTIGIKNEIQLGGRAGVTVGNAMPYAHVSWSRLDTDLVGHVDGWKLGPGVEFQIPNSNVALDLRASFGTYDKPGGIPVDAHTTEVRVGMVYRFGAPAVLAAPLK